MVARFALTEGVNGVLKSLRASIVEDLKQLHELPLDTLARRTRIYVRMVENIRLAKAGKKIAFAARSRFRGALSRIGAVVVGGTDPHRDPRLLRSDPSAFCSWSS